MLKKNVKSIFLAFLLLVLSCNTTKVTIDTKNIVKRPKKEYPVGEEFKILPNMVIQGSDKKAWVISPTEIRSTYYKNEKSWKLQESIEDKPKLKAPGFPLLEALYNMALEESKLDILKDSMAFMAGEKWKGVWTRDISYSIHLALAMIYPEVSKTSLEAKVNNNGVIIQDTGTGGSWPISTDRVVWALAAWEVYKVTGDNLWLEYSYNIIERSVLRDNKTSFDKKTGLFKGESSFMDWREQSYPKWMGPTEIGESKSISTNVAHYSSRKILSLMAKELGLKDEAVSWEYEANKLKSSINSNLWLEEKGYFSSFMYPNIMGGVLSKKTDSLGESLAVIQGVVSDNRATELVENLPVVEFGVPSLHPQIKGIRPYHNRGIWPFVTAYFTWAGSKTKNMEVVDYGLKSLTRASALFLSNYENMVYDNGHNSGTEINSSRQLWSVAGYLSLIYRDLFGMEWTSAGLEFNPMVPSWIEGELNLSNFRLREAVLDISISGHGSKVKSFNLDGETYLSNTLPYDLIGDHTVEIILESDEINSKINVVNSGIESPGVPQLKYSIEDNKVVLKWRPVSEGYKYGIFKNGELTKIVEDLTYIDNLDSDKTSIYSVLAYSENGIESGYSNYVVTNYSDGSQTIPVESGKYLDDRLVKNPRSSRTFDNYIAIRNSKDDRVELNFEVGKKGLYLIRFDYINNNGHVSTENKCAIRSAELDGEFVGKFIFPQRGGLNKKVGYSNSIELLLDSGKHSLALFYANDDQNMNIEINNAELGNLYILPIE